MKPNLPYPEFYIGSPVDSVDLRYRNEFITDLWEALGNNHVLLTAPRRTGKTSVMEYLRTHPQHGYTVIYENVQDLSHPADFFTSLLANFYETHPKLFRDIFGKGKNIFNQALNRIGEVALGEFKVALRECDPHWYECWRDHGDTFFTILRADKSPILIIVDELPDMLLNLKKEDQKLMREFLAWFRSRRTSPIPSNDSIRWLVGGSVNLTSTLDAIGMGDLVNDFDPKPLPILGPDDVTDFAQTMLSDRSVPFASEVPAHVEQHLGRPIPLFLQMATQDLFRIWRKQDRKLVPSDVDQAFLDLVTSNAAYDKLQHYYSRIRQYYTHPKDRAAYELLAQLSLSPEGLSRNRLLNTFEQILHDEGIDLPVHERRQQFNQLMHDLENDFYVSEISDQQYDFCSGLLKAWWRKYYA